MSFVDNLTRAWLLRQARRAVAADLAGAQPEPSEPPPTALPDSGAFVTIRRGERLRGCIGTFSPDGPLPETIRRVAVAAAHDPRFEQMPIRFAELDDLSFEISVLSPLSRVASPEEIEVGRHGVFVRQGQRTGCFLPDVATERGWDRETFLSECCGNKAMIDPMAWRRPETELYVFTVEKFCDGVRRAGP
jgi:hypothetical protein